MLCPARARPSPDELVSGSLPRLRVSGPGCCVSFELALRDDRDWPRIVRMAEDGPFGGGRPVDLRSSSPSSSSLT